MLGNPGQGARRWHFQQASDTQVAHGSHAQIPTNWRGQLAHQPPENLPTIVDDLPIGVRQQASSGIVGGNGPRQRGEARDSRLHVHGVEGSRHAERNESGAPRRISCQRSQLLSRTSRDNLAAAIVVGCRQAVCLESGKHVVRITPDNGRHRGRGHRAGFGHSAATLAYQDHRLFRRQDADPGCSGDLAYRVPGNDADERKAIGWMREEFECGQQPSGT